MSLVEPPLWQYITILIAIVGASIGVTKYISRVEGKIKEETTRLDGRINVVETQINNIRTELDRQRNEFSQWRQLFTEAGFNAITGKLKGGAQDG